MTNRHTAATPDAKEARREVEAAIEEMQAVAELIDATDHQTATDEDVAEITRQFHAAELRLDTAERDLEAAVATASTSNPANTNRKHKHAMNPVTTIDAPDGIYRPGPEQPKFFADLIAARQGDTNAADRLARHNADAEARDLTTTATSGGEFVPPFYILDEWAAAVRTTRPVADICTRRALPAYGDTVVLPRVTTGGTVSAHVESGNVSSTDPVTAEVTSKVASIAGQIDVSRKAFERSAPGLDQVLAGDLLAAFDAELDRNVLYGSNSNGEWLGIDGSVGTTITYTAATPTFQALLPKLAEAVSAFSLNRKRPPTHWILSPRRWADILKAVDSTGRPLVTPDGPMANAGMPGPVAAEGKVGTLLGIPVVTTANVKTTVGSGTNQDEIFLVNAEDLHLYETSPVMRVFEDVLSGTGAIRVQVYSYSAFVVARTEGIVKVTGTGLTNPF